MNKIMCFLVTLGHAKVHLSSLEQLLNGVVPNCYRVLCRLVSYSPSLTDSFSFIRLFCRSCHFMFVPKICYYVCTRYILCLHYISIIMFVLSISGLRRYYVSSDSCYVCTRYVIMFVSETYYVCIIYTLLCLYQVFHVMFIKILSCIIWISMFVQGMLLCYYICTGYVMFVRDVYACLFYMY